MKPNIHLLVDVFMCIMVEVRGSHYLTQLSSHESTVIRRGVLNKKINVSKLPKINVGKLPKINVGKLPKINVGKLPKINVSKLPKINWQQTHGNIDLWNTIL